MCFSPVGYAVHDWVEGQAAQAGKSARVWAVPSRAQDPSGVFGGDRGSGKSRAFVHALSITLVGQGSWFVSSFDAELPIAVSHLPAP